MARITIAALQAENAQLRELLAKEIELSKAWEHAARCAKRDLVRLRSTAPAAPHVLGVDAFKERVAAYCAKHGVKTCTREQAMSMELHA